MSIKSCLVIVKEFGKDEEFAKFNTIKEEFTEEILLAINKLDDTCQDIIIVSLNYSIDSPDIIFFCQEEELNKIPIARFLALQNANKQFSLQLKLLLEPIQLILVQVFRVSLSIPIPGQINVSVLLENPSVAITRLPIPD